MVLRFTYNRRDNFYLLTQSVNCLIKVLLLTKKFEKEMLNITKLKYVSKRLKRTREDTPFRSIFDNSEDRSLTRFLVLHVQCSVNSYVARKEILMDRIFRTFVYVIFHKSSEQI